jgi:hypothetical protein
MASALLAGFFIGENKERREEVVGTTAYLYLFSTLKIEAKPKHLLHKFEQSVFTIECPLQDYAGARCIHLN